MKLHSIFKSLHPRPDARVILSIIATGLLVAGILSPLTQVSGSTPETSAPEATSLVVGMASDVITLDPAYVTDQNSMLLVSQMFDALTFQPPSATTPQPALALSWTSTPDGQTWDFTIRPGVTFHDGTPLDAQAVIFNVERWWDPLNPYHDYFGYFDAMFGGFKGDEGCILSEVNLLGDDTVQFVLSEPLYVLPTILSMPSFAIASPAAIQAGTLAEHPVGSGPFKFLGRVSGINIDLEADPAYWGTPTSLSLLQFVVIPASEDRLQALLDGSIDSSGDLTIEHALIAVDQPSLQVQWRESDKLGYLGINSAVPGLSDPQVRQAIAHAINLPGLIANHYPFGSQPADQFLPSAIWGRDPELDGYSYDPDLSVSLMSQAGYTDVYTTTLAYRNVVRAYLPDPPAVAEDIRASLLQVGIDATIIEYESAEFLDAWVNGELELFLLGWGADYLHPDNFFSPILCDPNNLGFGPLDLTLCTLVQNARSDPDTLDQLALYQAASQRVYDTVPLVPIAHPRSALVMQADIEGVDAHPSGLETYKDASYPGVEQVLIEPETETSLVFTDDAMTTTIAVPAGAVDESTLLRFVVTDPDTAPPDTLNAGVGFDLDASRDGDILEDFTFNEPVTFTINYTDADVFFVQEETLLLFYWDGSQWLDAATTCDPVSTYARDLVANQISLEVCHLTPFGLFAEGKMFRFLPLVQK